MGTHHELRILVEKYRQHAHLFMKGSDAHRMAHKHADMLEEVLEEGEYDE